MPNLAWFFLFCKLKDASDIQSDAVLNYGQWFYYGGIFFFSKEYTYNVLQVILELIIS